MSMRNRRRSRVWAKQYIHGCFQSVTLRHRVGGPTSWECQTQNAHWMSLFPVTLRPTRCVPDAMFQLYGICEFPFALQAARCHAGVSSANSIWQKSDKVHVSSYCVTCAPRPPIPFPRVDVTVFEDNLLIGRHPSQLRGKYILAPFGGRPMTMVSDAIREIHEQIICRRRSAPTHPQLPPRFPPHEPRGPCPLWLSMPSGLKLRHLRSIYLPNSQKTCSDTCQCELQLCEKCRKTRTMKS